MVRRNLPANIVVVDIKTRSNVTKLKDDGIHLIPRRDEITLLTLSVLWGALLFEVDIEKKFHKFMFLENSEAREHSFRFDSNFSLKLSDFSDKFWRLVQAGRDFDSCSGLNMMATRDSRVTFEHSMGLTIFSKLI